MEENIEKAHIQDQYIMLRCNSNEGKLVLGIWIHDSTQRERFCSSILRTSEVRKSSPGVLSILSKFVKNAPVVAASGDNQSSTLLSTLSTPVPANLTSALTSSIKSSEASPGKSLQANKLLLLLKASPSSDAKVKVSNQIYSHDTTKFSTSPTASASTSIESATLDDIMTKPEAIKSIHSSNEASSTLFSLLRGNKSAASEIVEIFPTDVLTSAESKKLSPSLPSFVSEAAFMSNQTSQQPASVGKLPISCEQSATALKLALSISSSSTPSRNSSGNSGIGFSPVSHSMNAASDETVVAAFDLPSDMSTSTSPVTVAVSSLNALSHLPSKELFRDHLVFSANVAPSRSSSAKKPVKLISPSDLGFAF